MDLLTAIETLQQELNALDATRAEPHPPSDQAALDDEWNTLMKRMDELCELYWNQVEDERSCDRCAGCANCEESAAYDETDEV